MKNKHRIILDQQTLRHKKIIKMKTLAILSKKNIYDNKLLKEYYI